MKKNCELCKGLARMHCESDQASLCRSCDFKVHTANFLVARHSRTLLCHVCQSPTPWTATGTKLGRTVSVCDNCVHNCNKLKGDAEKDEEIESENRDEVGFEEEVKEEDDNEEEEDEEEEEEEEEDDEDKDIDNGDNQVVPWSPTTPPPPASPSSNNEEDSYSSSSSSSSSSRRDRREAQRKRKRENVSDHRLNVNRYCTSSRENVNKAPDTVSDAAEAVAVAVAGGGGEGVRGVDSTGERSLKRGKIDMDRVGLTGSNSWAVVESVKRLRRPVTRSSAAVADFCKLLEDPSAVCFDSSKCS